MVMCLALLISSFSQSVPHLIITQGVIYALPGSITYFPAMYWLGEWFIERRGFGYGVMWSGSGIGGSTIPLILELLLQKYGPRTTPRIRAVALFVLTMPVAYFSNLYHGVPSF
jgi:MFS family permease